jgi:hypothetical protein
MTLGARLATSAAALSGLAALAVSVSARAGTPAPGGGGCGAWAAIGWYTGCDRAADPPPPPSGSLVIARTTTTTEGELSARVVARSLRRHGAELLACHSDGEVALTFTIAPTGRAHAVAASACLTAAIGKITFPSGEDYTVVRTRLSFTTPQPNLLETRS